jgi:hypothetical protein
MANVSDDFEDSSIELKNVLLKEAARLTDAIDEIERESEDHAGYLGYVKYFLVDCGSLCDDIISASNNNAVLLAMLGVRVLIEDCINVQYLSIKESDSERVELSKEWLQKSNDPDGHLNHLDGKSIAQRARESGEDVRALYEGEYALFCKYTHGGAQRSLLNVDHLRALASKKATLASIKTFANILACVGDVTGIAVDQEAIDKTREYLDKYRKTVTEAQLPIEA